MKRNKGRNSNRLFLVLSRDAYWHCIFYPLVLYEKQYAIWCDRVLTKIQLHDHFSAGFLQDFNQS